MLQAHRLQRAVGEAKINFKVKSLPSENQLTELENRLLPAIRIWMTLLIF